MASASVLGLMVFLPTSLIEGSDRQDVEGVPVQLPRSMALLVDWQ